MPRKLGVSRRHLSPPSAPDAMRRQRSLKTPTATQPASNTASAIQTLKPSLPKKASTIAATETPSPGTRSSCNQRRVVSSRQRESGPTAINGITSAISGTNTALKYGGPTEYLPRENASMMSGNNVPRSTTIVDTVNTRLLIMSSDSRETPA